MYTYKIELRAPFGRSTVAAGRGTVRVKHIEADTATVTHYLYGQRSIEGAKKSLVRELPLIRRRAGVQLTEKDVNMGIKSKMFKFDRISH